MASSTATTTLSLRLLFTTASTTTAATKLPFSLHPKPFLSFSPSFSSTTTKLISFQSIPTARSTPPPPPRSTSSPSQTQPIQDLPPSLQSIVTLFQSVPDPKSKYQQLLFYANKLKPLDPAFKTPENKVQGCVSQVWVRAYLDSDSGSDDVVVFEADSDSVLTKGLAALLIQGLSGRPAHEILRVSPDFVALLGLQQSLTPSRNNGFLNMLRLMQKKAAALVTAAPADAGSGGSNGAADSKGTLLDSDADLGGNFVSELGDDRGAAISGQKSELEVDNRGKSGDLGSRGRRIKEKLERELSPVELRVEDVSYQHAGHAGARGGDGETHFNLKIVSKEFEGKSLVKRHRLVYALLQEELQSGLHALSIEAKTPSEINAR